METCEMINNNDTQKTIVLDSHSIDPIKNKHKNSQITDLFNAMQTQHQQQISIMQAQYQQQISIIQTQHQQQISIMQQLYQQQIDMTQKHKK